MVYSEINFSGQYFYFYNRRDGEDDGGEGELNDLGGGSSVSATRAASRPPSAGLVSLLPGHEPVRHCCRDFGYEPECGTKININTGLASFNDSNINHGIMLLKVFKVTQTKEIAEATNLDPPLPPPLLSPLPPPRKPATWPANEVEDR